MLNIEFKYLIIDKKCYWCSGGLVTVTFNMDNGDDI